MKDVGILFDLDGTLLDTLEDLADATNFVMDTFGFPRRTIEEVRRFVGNGAMGLIRLAVPEGTAPDRAEEAFRAFQTHYRANCQKKTRAYDGIPQVLAWLKDQGYPVAIVSNKPDAAVKVLCADYFPGLYARGEAPDCPRKPAPDMAWKAAEYLGVKPERCIYVGDSDVDVRTARNAGMEPLSVLWGFRDEQEIRAAGGIHFCRTPAELPEIVIELEKQINGL
ncbi:MAG: HAD family hydrolase [Oscillospiraceae bacterium]|nr:HAD family hydrolase [Oscillospiraceae bacterium]